MQTIVTLAKLLSDSFTNGPRVSDATGRTIRILNDDAPDWMKPVIFAAHGDMGPDDWRYEMIEAACDAIAELDEEADDIECLAAVEAIEPDIYTGELGRWLTSRDDRHAYCDSALEETGATFQNTIALIQAGQQFEMSEIGVALVAALMEAVEQQNESEAA